MGKFNSKFEQIESRNASRNGLCSTFEGLLYIQHQLQINSLNIKVKQSHYRPGQALRVPVGLGSQISRQSAHVGGKVSHTHRLPLYPGNIPGTHFL
jgi:hypothetical protein